MVLGRTDLVIDTARDNVWLRAVDRVGNIAVGQYRSVPEIGCPEAYVFIGCNDNN